MSLLSRIVGLITTAEKTSVTDHDVNMPVAQASWLGKVGEVAIIYPYGSMGSAPVGSMLLKFNIESKEGNSAGIEFAPNLLDKELKDGEYVCGNFVVGSTIKFDENGKIIITGVSDVDIETTGNVNVTGATVNIGENCNLGSGGSAIARVGDAVSVVVTGGSSAGTYAGTITTGSLKHTAD